MREEEYKGLRRDLKPGETFVHNQGIEIKNVSDSNIEIKILVRKKNSKIQMENKNEDSRK